MNGDLVRNKAIGEDRGLSAMKRIMDFKIACRGWDWEGVFTFAFIFIFPGKG
jgi:hypothetical protein